MTISFARASIPYFAAFGAFAAGLLRILYMGWDPTSSTVLNIVAIIFYAIGGALIGSAVYGVLLKLRS